jgi:GntP family gluconate:H+ symporter
MIGRRVVKAAPAPQPAPAPVHPSLSDQRNLVLPTLIPLVLLVLAAFAQIPSEPLGREAKDFFVFFTRPTVILTLSLVLALLMYWRWDREAVSQSGWLGAALTASVGPLLAVGAAGGFIGLIQATGMAELVAERITELRLGILVPFLVAAVLKILQGSPLVATLSTAGMIEPLLATLGLDDATGRALTAAAIGAGTLIAHVNDPYFWVIADAAETSPTQTLGLYTLGTLVQASIVVAVLLLICAIR